jgi:isopenicillin-N epimerase
MSMVEPTASSSGGAGPAWSPLAAHWGLDRSVVFLNHGSFGATPLAVLEAQREYRARLEREPIRFMVEELEGLLDGARAAAGAFVGCNPDDLAFVLNATMGVNTVVRSLAFEPGDELLTSTHEYNACNNALEYMASRSGARVVRAEPPFPVRSEDEVAEAILSRVTPRTKLVLLSHITSPTALVLPVERLVRALERRGIDTLVDGAHAPGMIPLDVERIGAAYYTGNFHKWTCAPKGAAFLHVRRDRQHLLRPLVISHGANSARKDRPRFRLEMDFLGSMDYSAWLAVPDAIAVVGSLLSGGWDEVRRRNRAMALAARDLLCRELGAQPSAPDSMTGSMAAVRLPDRTAAEAAQATRYADPLQDRLIARHGVQVPIVPFPAPPARWVRVSAQLYNTAEQYEHLARALRAELHGPGGR